MPWTWEVSDLFLPKNASNYSSSTISCLISHHPVFNAFLRAHLLQVTFLKRKNGLLKKAYEVGLQIKVLATALSPPTFCSVANPREFMGFEAISGTYQLATIY